MPGRFVTGSNLKPAASISLRKTSWPARTCFKTNSVLRPSTRSKSITTNLPSGLSAWRIDASVFSGFSR